MKITAEMRAAIDAAVADGRVTRVEPNVTAAPVASPERPSAFTALTREDRQKRVAELAAAGKTIGEIARLCRVSPQTIMNDKKALGLVGSTSPAPAKPAPERQPEAPPPSAAAPMDASLLAYIGEAELDRIKAKIITQIDGLLALAAQIQREMDRRAK